MKIVLFEKVSARFLNNIVRFLLQMNFRDKFVRLAVRTPLPFKPANFQRKQACLDAQVIRRWMAFNMPDAPAPRLKI